MRYWLLRLAVIWLVLSGCLSLTPRPQPIPTAVATPTLPPLALPISADTAPGLQLRSQETFDISTFTTEEPWLLYPQPAFPYRYAHISYVALQGDRVLGMLWDDQLNSDWGALRSTISLIDISGGTQLWSLELDGLERPLAWSPTRDRLALGMGSRVQVREVETGEVLVQFQANDRAGKLAWSPDGAKLAVSGYTYAAIDIFDVVSGERLLTIPGSLSPTVNSLTWSPDSTWLAAGYDTGRISLVDVVHRTVDIAVSGNAHSPHGEVYFGMLEDFYIKGGGVVCLSFSPDGQRLVFRELIAGENESPSVPYPMVRFLKLLDIRSRDLVFSTEEDESSSPLTALCPVWSTDQSVLVSYDAYGNSLLFRNAGDGLLLSHFNLGMINRDQSDVVAGMWLSPNGQTLTLVRIGSDTFSGEHHTWKQVEVILQSFQSSGNPNPH